MNRRLILVSGGCVAKLNKQKTYWFVTKQSDDGDFWELPKVIVRKGESSVRAIIRAIGEKGGMTARILEEVGRAGGTRASNGRVFPQRFIYYLMLLKSKPSEAVGFVDSVWLEFPNAIRKLSMKREKEILREAKRKLKEWERKNQRRAPKRI